MTTTSGAKTQSEAKEFYIKCKDTLSDGGFNLRKFKSNSAELENEIYKEYPNDKMFSDEEKVLGMNWDRNCLLYTSPSPRDQRGSRMPSSA